jgi:hypothetical protein
MVGYIRGTYTISPKLVDALKAKTKEIPTAVDPQPCSRSKGSATSEVVHSSLHPRKFNYLENGKAAPPIDMRHLWLRRG